MSKSQITTKQINTIIYKNSNIMNNCILKKIKIKNINKNKHNNRSDNCNISSAK